MSLDLGGIALQIEGAARNLKAGAAGRRQRLLEAHTLLASADPDLLRSRQEEATKTRLSPLTVGIGEPPGNRYDLPKAPGDFCVMAVDGSQIEADRHMPLQCYLINVGRCTLTYGSHPDAHLSNEARLYAAEEELYLADPKDASSRRLVQGPLLSAKRAVAETASLARLVEQQPSHLPSLALLDGSLILWSLAQQELPSFLREVLLRRGFLKGLDSIHQQARTRPIALASYISYPRGSEVLNTLALVAVPTEVGTEGEGPFRGLLDRELFYEHLGPRQRSALFQSRSWILGEYGIHTVSFFYLHTGMEIARVEVPAWVAQRGDLLELAHALVMDQVERGQGYPVALAEAHEQAVVTAADRESFWALVSQALENQRLPVETSQKSFAKRSRAL